MESNINNLNNNAVTLLQNGEYASAFSQLRLALKLFHSRVNADDTTHNEESAQQRSSNDTIPTTEDHNTNNRNEIPTSTDNEEHQVISSVPVINDPLLCAEEDDATSPHNIFCFYSRAFNILPSTELATATTANDASCSRRPNTTTTTQGQQSELHPENHHQEQGDNDIDMSVILLFNMGVVFHHQALATGKLAKLDKALGIYKMIITIMGDEIYPEEVVSHNDTMDTSIINCRHLSKVRLLLATYSNMAHIHYHSFNRQEASRCAVMIRRNLSYTPHINENLEVDEINTFFLNCTADDKQKSSLAPAA